MLLKARKNKGFTFIEMMVTIIILSAGIVGLFKSFLICVDYIDHMTYRMRALELLNYKLESVQTRFRNANEPFHFGNIQEQSQVGHKNVNYVYTINVTPVGELSSLLQMDMSISWKEKDVWRKLNRSVYLSNITSINPISL